MAPRWRSSVERIIVVMMHKQRGPALGLLRFLCPEVQGGPCRAECPLNTLCNAQHW
jgi:hypothetical protein